MKRIHLTRAFLIGVLATLIVGGVAATLAASTKERVNDEPLRVPVGRDQDRVVYAFYRGESAAEREWNAFGPYGIGAPALARVVADPAARDKPLAAAGARSFTASGLVSAYDAAHTRHDALLVIRNETLPDAPGYTYTVVEHVDLASRKVFRLDENAAVSADKQSSLFVRNVQSSTFDVRDSALPGLAYQGRTLQLGDVLHDGPLPIPVSLAGKVADLHAREWVESRQRVNGIDAYGVRLEVRYTAVPLTPSMTMDAAAPTPDLPTADVTAWRIDWMSADHGYAVLREAGLRITRDGQVLDVDAYRVAYVLQTVERSGDFVPWRAHEAAWAAARSDLERSGTSQLHPATGSASNLPYPLEEALQWVQADVTLVPYHLWRQTHPGAILAGARHAVATGTATGTPVAEWRFVFATPAGEAYQVAAQRDLQTGTRSGQALGEQRVPAFHPNDLPRNPPTIGALEATWADYVSGPARSQPFNYVRWGLDLTEDRKACASAPDFRFGTADLELFKYVEGGHSRTGRCPGALQSAGSAIIMEVATGRTVGAYESDFGYSDASRFPFAEEMRRGWQRAASTVPVGVRPPSAGEAAATSAGFLAVFLALYFWPALKYAGAALVAPLYAKIHKEDLLNNPVREHVLQLIRDHPGIHASDLARQTGAGWGTIVYHLGVLERNKVVTSLVDGRHKRFFPADTVDYSKRGQLAALMNANTRRIYEVIEAEPGIVQGELAGRLGITIPTVIWHLQRLQEAGLVGRDKNGRRFHYFANPVYQPKGSAPTQEGFEVQ